MKKVILFACMLAASVSHAAIVDVNSAKTVAANFYSNHSNKTITGITTAFTELASDNTPAYYVFNINSNDGFVIVTADDAALPILGYATAGHYDAGNVAPNCASTLNGYKQQIISIKAKGIQSTSAIDIQWQSLKSNQSQARVMSGYSVGPLLTTTWSQNPFYNDSCPGGSVTGCVATAMAQVMKYWNFPAQGTGSNSYCDCTADGFQMQYGTIAVNFGNRTYHWSSMPNNVAAHNSAVATLMYDCGVSVDMDFSPSGSGASVTPHDSLVSGWYNVSGMVCSQTSYVKYFGYNGSTIQSLQRNAYTDSAWIAILVNELNKYRPIQYAGGIGECLCGHTWVCDGYDGNTNFHMNWGWGGEDNGFFNLDALNPSGENFTYQQEALIGIEPANTCLPPASAYSYADSVNTVTFLDSSSASATHWHWSFGDGDTSNVQNPVHTYAQSSYYTACLTVSDSCGPSTACKNLVVGTCPPPAVAFNYTVESSGLSLLFADESYGATKWHWNFGNGDTSDAQNPAYTYTKNGNYTVCLSAGNSCGTDSSCQTIDITCSAYFYAINFDYDSLLTVYFFDESYYGASIWYWDFGDGTTSNAQNPVHTYSQSGSYKVKESVWDACGHTSSVTNEVYATSCKVTAGYFYTDSANTFSCFDTSSSGVTAWHWDFGDGDTSNLQNPVHTYSSSYPYGLSFWYYDVCLTASDGCGSNTYCNEVTVGCYSTPVANFSYSDSALTASFFNSGSNAVSWKWNFGDSTTSNMANPVHTYSNAGIYSVTLTAYDACRDSSSVTEQVELFTTSCPVKAAFSYSDSITTVSFIDFSSAGVNSWAWNFGDRGTSTLENPVHVYNYSGSYKVCLTVSDSCGSNNVCRSIYAGCVSPLANLAYGDSLLTAHFFDYSDSSAVLWHWDFGDGDTSNTVNPVHIYSQAGTYYVTLTSYDACGDNSQASQIMTLAACAAPSISATGKVLTSSAATGNQWYLNNTIITGATSQNYTVTVNGSYTVQVADGNACTVMSAVYHYNSVGIEESVITNFELEVYPNPTEGIFEVHISNNQLPITNYQLSIYNVLGERVYKSSVNDHSSLTANAPITIDLSSQPAGVYFLRLQSGEGVVSKKIVIE